MDAVLLAEVNVIEHVHVTTNKCNELKKAKKNKHRGKKTRSYGHASHACQQVVPPEVHGAELVGDPLYMQVSINHY
jgi:hypothetical protein